MHTHKGHSQLLRVSFLFCENKLLKNNKNILTNEFLCGIIQTWENMWDKKNDRCKKIRLLAAECFYGV